MRSNRYRARDAAGDKENAQLYENEKTVNDPRAESGHPNHSGPNGA